MMTLQSAYNSVLARVKIWLGLSAKVTTAPAEELEADSPVSIAKTATAIQRPAEEMEAARAVTTSTSVPLGTHGAAEVNVDSRPAPGVLAGLVAYARAPFVYIKGVIMGRLAGLAAAPGTATEYDEVLTVGRIAQADTADSAPVKAGSSFTADSVAVGSSADAIDTRAARATPATVTAGAARADAQTVNVQRALGVAPSARIGLAFAVNFADYAGNVLYSTIVKSGDACPDPVSMGELATPTRPSDAQYHYTTFLGWSMTNGGNVDEGILDSITKPITLYPVFEKELRYYDITFYDGTDILLVLSVAYGDTPSYTPEKTGYVFVGWTPEIVPVTGEAVYGAMWVADCIASGTCGDNVTWVLTKTGEFIISGQGAMYDYSTETERPWYAYLSEVKTVLVEDGVTHIGIRAFQNCTNLISATIAESVTTFGTHVFIYCSSLTSVNIPQNVTELPMSLFHTCTAMASIIIPDSVTSIGQHAFRATGLTSITIPDSVTIIGAYAFYQCTSLASATIGNGVITIDYYAFHTCTALKTLTMGSNVVTINYRAFQGCSVLPSITIPATAKTIGDNVFYGCSALNSIVFKDPYNWYRYSSSTATSGYAVHYSYFNTTTTAANYLRNTWKNYWFRK